MADWFWSVGEQGTVYLPQLTDATGAVIDLTGKTVTLVWTTYPTAGTRNTKTCTLVDAPNGKVSYTTTSADTTTAGEYGYDFEISSAGYLDVIPKDGAEHTFKIVAKL